MVAGTSQADKNDAQYAARGAEHSENKTRAPNNFS